MILIRNILFKARNIKNINLEKSNMLSNNVHMVFRIGFRLRRDQDGMGLIGAIIMKLSGWHEEKN